VHSGMAASSKIYVLSLIDSREDYLVFPPISPSYRVVVFSPLPSRIEGYCPLSLSGRRFFASP